MTSPITGLARRAVPCGRRGPIIPLYAAQTSASARADGIDGARRPPSDGDRLSASGRVCAVLGHRWRGRHHGAGRSADACADVWGACCRGPAETSRALQGATRLSCPSRFAIGRLGVQTRTHRSMCVELCERATLACVRRECCGTRAIRRPHSEARSPYSGVCARARNLSFAGAGSQADVHPSLEDDAGKRQRPRDDPMDTEMKFAEATRRRPGAWINDGHTRHMRAQRFPGRT